MVFPEGKVTAISLDELLNVLGSVVQEAAAHVVDRDTDEQPLGRDEASEAHGGNLLNGFLSQLGIDAEDLENVADDEDDAACGEHCHLVGGSGEQRVSSGAMYAYQEAREKVIAFALPGVAQSTVEVELSREGVTVSGVADFPVSSARMDFLDVDTEGVAVLDGMKYEHFHPMVIDNPESAAQKASFEYADGMVIVRVPVVPVDARFKVAAV